MYSTVLLEHPPQIILIHGSGHLTHEHFDGVWIRLFLILNLPGRFEDVVVRTGVIVIVVVRLRGIVVIHRYRTETDRKKAVL